MIKVHRDLEHLPQFKNAVITIGTFDGVHLGHQQIIKLLKEEVAKTAPCPFLGEDNYCSIYDERPGDCARFPYTNEDVLLKRPQITLKNSTFCPIVHFVLENLISKHR